MSSPESPASERPGFFASAKAVFLNLFDADYTIPGREKYFKPDTELIDPVRLIPYIFLHSGCLLVIWAGWSWTAVAVAAFLYFVRMFAITGFYHRYFSHKSFKTSRWFQFVMAVWGNTSMQRGPLWWASTHRHHHKHSDHEGDKHSVRMHGFLWAHIGWMTCSKNFPTDYSKIKDLTKYPELKFLNKYDFIVPVSLGVLLWITGALLERFAPGLGTNGFQIFTWGFFISTVVLLHGTLFINSMAHAFGKRRFKTTDDSRNSLILALITLGEGWHNNHHRYHGSTRQGFYWWEIDITYYILKLFSKVGLIRDLRAVPEHIYEEARNGGVEEVKKAA